jgi:hypothetical protein
VRERYRLRRRIAEPAQLSLLAHRRAVPVDSATSLASLSAVMSPLHAAAMRSLTLFGREVLPAFR